MAYYICRRAFRDRKGPVPVGSIIDPAGTKRFRFRLQEGHIVKIDSANFDKYAAFFKQRYNITLKPLNAAPVVPDLKPDLEPDIEPDIESEQVIAEPTVVKVHVSETIKAVPTIKVKTTV